MSLAILPPLLAAAEWLKLAIFLVIGFFWIMKKLYDLNKEAAAKQVRPQPAQQPVQPRPQAPAQMQMAAGGQQADPLRSQVEEFLRRAGRTQAGPAASPPVSQRQPATNTEAASGERPRSQERRAAASSSPAAQTSQQRPRGKKPRQSVAEHVAERVTSRSKNVAAQTSRLGQRIVAEDQQFDDQLNAKFDHTVGTLADSVNPVALEAPPPPADTPARQIAEMLANPEGVRQAVILNEILRRPSDRW
jgi:hypothetical protein